MPENIRNAFICHLSIYTRKEQWKALLCLNSSGSEPEPNRGFKQTTELLPNRMPLPHNNLRRDQSDIRQLRLQNLQMYRGQHVDIHLICKIKPFCIFGCSVAVCPWKSTYKGTGQRSGTWCNRLSKFMWTYEWFTFLKIVPGSKVIHFAMYRTLLIISEPHKQDSFESLMKFDSKLSRCP